MAFSPQSRYILRLPFNGCVSRLLPSTCLIPRPKLTTTQFPEHSLRSYSGLSQYNRLLFPSSVDSLSIRLKSKSGKDGKNKKVKINITKEEFDEVVNSSKLEKEMEHFIEKLKHDYVHNTVVRSNVGSLEELEVELEGEKYPLNEIAQVHRKSPQLVMINCSAFPQASKGVLEAIRNSGMNLNPQQEGYAIAVPIPKVSKEHREGLVSKAKTLRTKCKEDLRKVHSNYVKKALEKEHQGVSQDLIHMATLKIKDMMDTHCKTADDMLKIKEKELLQK